MALQRDVGKYSPVSTRAPESDAAPVDRTPSARKGVWLAIAVDVGCMVAVTLNGLTLLRASDPADLERILRELRLAFASRLCAHGNGLTEM